jgi:hypothetical protein
VCSLHNIRLDRENINIEININQLTCVVDVSRMKSCSCFIGNIDCAAVNKLSIWQQE